MQDCSWVCLRVNTLMPEHYNDWWYSNEALCPYEMAAKSRRKDKNLITVSTFQFCETLQKHVGTKNKHMECKLRDFQKLIALESRYHVNCQTCWIVKHIHTMCMMNHLKNILMPFRVRKRDCLQMNKILLIYPSRKMHARRGSDKVY